MANINVVVEKPIADGYKLKFRTPCDSTIIEGLEVKYPAKNGVGTLIKKFVFKDAHGTELSGVGNLFVGGVLIEVLLDVTHSVAYIQNADTNSYVESVKSEVQRLEESQRQFLGVAGKAVEECERVTAETASAIEATNKATDTLVLTHEEFVSGGYVETLKEKNEGGKFSFWVGTTEEYYSIPEKVHNCFYILTDDVTGEDMKAAMENIAKESTEYPGCYYRMVDGEKEWLNPPMNETGIEYRTAKRHKGKVVYVINIPCGTFPNNSNLYVSYAEFPDIYDSVNGKSKMTEIVGYTATTGEFAIPARWCEYDAGIMKERLIDLVVAIWGINVNTNYDASSLVGYFTIEYTKD